MQIVRESIFISAIRSFINGLLAVLGILVGLIILVAVLASSMKPMTSPDQQLLLEVMPDEHGSTAVIAEANPAILQVDIEGEIGMGKLNADVIESMLRASRKDFLKNDRVKAILLNINSPGGGAVDSSNIHAALMKYKKQYNVPVYAFMNGLAASGGYFIACASDYIGATPPTIVGSVGVILGPFFNFYGFTQKHGIDTVMISSGTDKQQVPTFDPLPDKNDPKRPWKDLEVISKATYKQFSDVVLQARMPMGMTAQLLKNVYGAQVFIAEEAMQNHYIDNAMTTREEMLHHLAKQANITGEYQVYRFKHKGSFIDDLRETNLGRVISALFGVKPSAKESYPVSLYFDPS